MQILDSAPYILNQKLQGGTQQKDVLTNFSGDSGASLDFEKH